MNGKMTKCKSCGAEIAKSAKSCPQCGAKRRTVGKTVCAVLLALFFVGILASLFGQDSEPTLAGTTTNKPEGSAQPTEQPSVFKVGDIAELNDVNVTLVDVSENSGGNYMTPSDGKVFVVCEFEIENNSDKDVSVSSILSFNAYVDDYTTAMNLSAMLSTGKTQLDGTVAAGKKMNGVIGYEVSPDWKEIEIRFTPDFWFGKEIIFQYAK